MKKEEKFIFILGDQLPTYYDAGIAIYSICQTPNSIKMDKCITAYVNALISMWSKAFVEGYIISRKYIVD